MISHKKAVKNLYNIIDREIGDQSNPLDILYVTNKVVQLLQIDDEKQKSILGETIIIDDELISVDDAMNDNSFDYVFSQKCSLFPNNEDDNIFQLKRENSIDIERIISWTNIHQIKLKRV